MFFSLRPSRPACLVLVLLTAGSAAAERPPNVLLVMTDDQGWGDLHSHGNAQIDTPVLDQLGRESVRLERFFVSPVCAPTRASLLTGRDHLRTGVTWVSRRAEVMDSDEVTIAETFRDAGYRTGCFGKWHNGAQYPNHPLGQGFDEFFGFCAGHWNQYFDARLEHNGKAVQSNGYITDVLTDAALEFIGAQSETPFFCYVPYNAPHTPWQLPEPLFAKYQARGLDAATASAYGMVENIDTNVGRLLEKLDELRLSEQTIVVFLTDNGPNGERYNGRMRGRKGSVHEGGVRVPCFVRWRGQIAPRSVPQIAAHIDLLPTLVELCAIARPEGKPLDGRSLVPLLTHGSEDWPDRMLFTHRSGPEGAELDRGAVRTQQYRLVRESGRYRLYDMEADPGETTDVAPEHPKTFDRLRRGYEQWFRGFDEHHFGPPPIPVGYPEMPVVGLPATDAFFTGDVRFFEGHGWAHDWLTGWSDAEERIWWEVEVAQGGSYDVTLLYSCAAQHAGATVRVESGSQRLHATIDQPFDTGLKRRPERTDTTRYIREFAPLRLGTLHLPQGRTRLTLRAVSSPGEQVCDVQGLHLKRAE